MTDYIRTNSGQKLSVYDPDPGTILIQDIAAGLSKMVRWGGQSDFDYKVAAHSIHVSRMSGPRWALAGLLHDATEAYLADIPAPFKQALPDYKKLEKRLARAIFTKFGVPHHYGSAVAHADAAALYLERLHLFTIPVYSDVPEARPDFETEWDFVFWVSRPPVDLRDLFLREFDRLKP